MHRRPASTFSSTLTCAAAVIAAGCGEMPDETSQQVSALTTTSSDVRGFTDFSNTHIVVFRDISSSQVMQLTETSFPFAGGAGGLGGNVALGAAPWGYLRHDHASAILYVDPSGDVHEIDPGFSNSDFHTQFGINAPLASSNSGGPFPDVVGYRRDDGGGNFINSGVVYVSQDGHVIELISNFNGSPPWLVRDHTAGTPGAKSVLKGGAFPYVRSDHKNAIVYIASDSHIHEIISRFPNASADADLYDPTISAETATPLSELWAYKRSDDVNAIVYAASSNGTTQLHELSLNLNSGCNGKPWCAGIIPLSSGQSPSPSIFSRPSGYVRADDTNAVVYLSNNDNNFREVSLPKMGTSWSDAVLPLQSGVTPQGRPFGHQAPGNRSSVLYRGLDSFTGSQEVRVFELSLQNNSSWQRQVF